MKIYVVKHHYSVEELYLSLENAKERIEELEEEGYKSVYIEEMETED